MRVTANAQLLSPLYAVDNNFVTISAEKLVHTNLFTVSK